MLYAAIALRWVGYAYLAVAIVVIVASLLMIWWNDGFFAVTEILSPFNVLNWIVTAATLAPGIALLWLAEKIRPPA